MSAVGATTTATECSYNKVTLYDIGGRFMEMDIDQNTTISTLMQAVQKEKNWHVDAQRPVFNGKDLLTLPSDTKLVTLNLGSYIGKYGFPLIHIVVKQADRRLGPASNQLSENYYNAIRGVILISKKGFEAECEKLEAEQKAITEECEKELAAKETQFPSRAKFESTNPDGDWFAHVKSEAHHKEWDALENNKVFMHPSAALQARIDACTKNMKAYMAQK